MPAPRRVTPRVDLTAADLGTLAALGRADAPPPPSPDPPKRRGHWGPAPDKGRVERAAGLADALADAGVPVDSDNAAAVDALAGLDPATVATVTDWIRRGKRDPGGGRTP